jgi:hypothetical protein
MIATRLLPLVACVLVVACSPAAGSTPPLSPSPVVSPAGGPPRVMGTITAGPVCPVEQSPPDPRCAPRPVAGAVIVATDEGGQEVGRATSAADGTYELTAGQTGAVVLTALPVDGLARPPAPVRLVFNGPGEVEHIDLEYDTGIR